MNTHSNAAYNLDYFVNDSRVVSIDESRRRRDQENKKARSAAIIFDLMIALVFATCIFLLAIVMVSQSNLTSMTKEADALDEQLAVLQSDNTRLNSELTAIASTEKIAAYAEKNGLRKAETGQVNYFSVNNQSVVEKAPPKENSVAEFLQNLFAS